MTRLSLPPEAAERRFRELEAAVAGRRALRRADPEAIAREHPVYTVLWDSLVWLHDYWMVLGGYVQRVAQSPAKGMEFIQCLEKSAAENKIETVTERLLALHEALTCRDPALIDAPALRRLVAVARVNCAVAAAREEAET